MPLSGIKIARGMNPSVLAQGALETKCLFAYYVRKDLIAVFTLMAKYFTCDPEAELL